MSRFPKIAIVCQSCKKLIGFDYVGLRYNPFGPRYIKVSFVDPWTDWYLPAPSEGKVYKWGHFYCLGCWDKEVPDWPELVDIVEDEGS